MNNRRYHINECDSSNILLKSMSVNSSLEEFFIVSTDFQTAGKGQVGNSWESEKAKNLLFSVLLFPHKIAIKEQFLISQIISLAIKNVFDKYAEGFTIKWPNDIYWNNKKIGGILIENSLFKNRIQKSIIGIGLNINQELFLSNAPNPISLKQIKAKEQNREEILEKIIIEFESIYTNMPTSTIRQLYAHNLYRKNGYHSYFDVENKEEFTAKIDRIENDGRLILIDKDNTERAFYFKEVEYISKGTEL